MKLPVSRGTVLGYLLFAGLSLTALVVVGLWIQHILATRNQAICADNLRRIGQALRQYVTDHDDTWPTEAVWLKQKFTPLRLAGCPAARGIPKLDPPLPHTDSGLPGYAMNKGICSFESLEAGQKILRPLQTTAIWYPQNTIAVLDYARGISITNALNPYPPAIGYPSALERGWQRHNGGGNYLFCDGHAQWHTENQIFIPKTEACQSPGNQPTFCRN